MVGYEEKAAMSMVLATAAESLGRAITCVEVLARRDIDTVRVLSQEADRIVIEGPEIIRYLRMFIARMERGM